MKPLSRLEESALPALRRLSKNSCGSPVPEEVIRKIAQGRFEC
jgi:hypothetical protein